MMGLLMVFLTSKLCKDLSFLHWDTVGTCFVEQTLFGDVTLLGIIAFTLFGGLLIKYNFPMTMLLPVGIGLSYVLFIMTGADFFLGVMLLGLIISGAILMIAILQYLKE